MEVLQDSWAIWFIAPAAKSNLRGIRGGNVHIWVVASAVHKQLQSVFYNGEEWDIQPLRLISREHEIYIIVNDLF